MSSSDRVPLTNSNNDVWVIFHPSEVPNIELVSYNNVRLTIPNLSPNLSVKDLNFNTNYPNTFSSGFSPTIIIPISNILRNDSFTGSCTRQISINRFQPQSLSQSLFNVSKNMQCISQYIRGLNQIP